MKKICAYPGTFGPVTVGHEWIIEETLKIFDRLAVIIAQNAKKANVFDVFTRARLMEEVTKKYDGRVEVVRVPHLFTADTALQLKATHIVRGIRSGVDFDYERSVDLLNRDISHTLQGGKADHLSLTTIYLTPPRHLAEVSSSMVMGMVGYNHWEKIVKHYVSPPVFEAIKKAYDDGHIPKPA